jgi:hypothetical protein
LTTEAISSSRERKKVVPIPCQSTEDKNHMEEANLTISVKTTHNGIMVKQDIKKYRKAHQISNLSQTSYAK